MTEEAPQEDIERLHARIDRLEGTIGALLDAQTGGAESRLLRGELRKAFERIRELEEENRRLRDEMWEMRRKIAYYESENMSTSTASIYNDERRRFREGRGEDPKGGPGGEDQPGGGEGGGGGGDEEEEEEEDGVTRGPNGGRIGPPGRPRRGLAPQQGHPSAAVLPRGRRGVRVLQGAARGHAPRVQARVRP